MFRGIIQQAASPFEIYRQPANRFVANFVGGNNFLAATLNDGRVTLTAGGQAVADLSDMASGAVTASVRPENVAVSTARPSDSQIAILVRIRQVSFIGREVEVSGTTETGEIINANMRPTPELLALRPGAEVAMMFERRDVLVFEDLETGRRLA